MLNVAAQRFWTRPDLPSLFPAYLIELYSMMRCSVPLMLAAFERASELAADDPLAAQTAIYLRAHIEEERHHDEWLLDDLEASGLDRELALRRAPSAAVARLIGTQYCWIHHAHPAALFGYLAILEGNPPTVQHLDEIQSLTGYPSESFRCLRLHAEDDVEHLQELQATIEQLALTPETMALISASSLETVQGLVSLLDRLTTTN
jgi:pyrroloquinoline quinone (PQQ) biosynthesis protein C